jgi:hypothetical protein
LPKSSKFMRVAESDSSSDLSGEPSTSIGSEALDNGIQEIAHGYADLMAAFIESLPHGRCFHEVGFALHDDAGTDDPRSRRR